LEEGSGLLKGNLFAFLESQAKEMKKAADIINKLADGRSVIIDSRD